jgi:subtilisin family serine protease
MASRRLVAVVVATIVVLSAGQPARADSIRDMQWWLAAMQVPQAQSLANGGVGVVVALIDSGINAKHQDLEGLATVPGRWQRGPDLGMDAANHGTEMASLIAGQGHGKNAGVMGIAPRAKIMSLGPSNDSSYLVENIHWAVQHGAKVISMSFGFGGKFIDDETRNALRDAYAADVVLVASAGNSAVAPVELPAAVDNVVAVGSTDKANKVAAFSNYGKELDLVAPGVGIIGAAGDGNRYYEADGTSNSTALVSGAVALIRAKYPDMKAPEVVDRLFRTAKDLGDPGRDDHYGYGELDLIKALTAPRTDPPASLLAPTPGASATAVDIAAAGTSSDFKPNPYKKLIFAGVGVVVLLAIAGLIVVIAAASRRRRRY